jgi:hypothetical protein
MGRQTNSSISKQTDTLATSLREDERTNERATNCANKHAHTAKPPIMPNKPTNTHYKKRTRGRPDAHARANDETLQRTNAQTKSQHTRATHTGAGRQTREQPAHKQTHAPEQANKPPTSRTHTHPRTQTNKPTNRQTEEPTRALASKRTDKNTNEQRHKQESEHASEQTGKQASQLASESASKRAS